MSYTNNDAYINKIVELYEYYCVSDISEFPDNPKKITKKFNKQQLRKLNRELLRMNKLIEEDTPSLSDILLLDLPDEDKKNLLEKFILFIQTEKNTEEFFDYRNEINKIIKDHKERVKRKTEEVTEFSTNKKRKILSEMEELKEKILSLNTTKENIDIITKKFDTLDDMRKNDSEYHKLKEYLKKITSVPFGKLCDSHINHVVINKSKELLDNHVMYNYEAKDEILNCLINGSNQPIALFGPPGTAKSTLVQKGISDALSRPMRVISLGGKKDASYLTGHSYTYEGSICGRIIDILIETKVMNPIIYFDELDKISGNDINGVLTHLIDPSQNFDFHDNYFSGISFDLSNVLFVFSYNNKTELDLIVSDRIKHIEVKVLNVQQKIKVMDKITIPNAINKYFKGTDTEFSFSEELLLYLANKYSDKGMRDIIREVDHIISRLKMLYVLKDAKHNDEETKYLKYRKMKLDFSQEIIIDTTMYNEYFKTDTKESMYHFSMYT